MIFLLADQTAALTLKFAPLEDRYSCPYSPAIYCLKKKEREI